tara:strand:- start:20446 stop:21477 length:1032 start_codon:yes stop_codon:yes gene_type:complete
MKKAIYLVFVFFQLMSVKEISAQKSFSKQKINSQIEQLVYEGKFSGSVLYYKNNAILFDKSYGFANRQANIKNGKGFKYNLGSINKLFTKIAITKLIMEGKLTLNDFAKKHVPELREKNTHKITIYHLLTMTSGFGDYLSDKEFTSNRKLYTKMSDYLPLILQKELTFEPGSDRGYSNVGYELLGIIIERVSGMDYYKYIQENIFDIAGMKNTGYYTFDDKVKDLSIGYHKDSNGNTLPNWNFKSYKGTAAGGGYSTVYDMLSLAKVLLTYKILDKNHTDLLCKKFNIANNRYYYISAAGGGPGINARLYLNRTKKEITVVLANQDSPSANLVNDIFKEMSKK